MPPLCPAGGQPCQHPCLLCGTRSPPVAGCGLPCYCCPRLRLPPCCGTLPGGSESGPGQNWRWQPLAGPATLPDRGFPPARSRLIGPTPFHSPVCRGEMGPQNKSDPGDSILSLWFSTACQLLRSWSAKKGDCSVAAKGTPVGGHFIAGIRLPARERGPQVLLAPTINTPLTLYPFNRAHLHSGIRSRVWG